MTSAGFIPIIRSMKTVRTALLAAVFWGVPFLQSFHHHHFHAGGISEDHVDCLVCPWSQDVHATALVDVAVALAVSFCLLSVARASAGCEDLPLVRAFNSRAPPLLPL